MSGFVEQLVGAHSKIVHDKLDHLYHLKPSLDLLQTRPRECARAFLGYASLFPRFFNLDTHEINIVDRVAFDLKKSPHKSATVFREKFSKYKNLFEDVAFSIADPGTSYYREGIHMLTTMMTEAWDMKLDGLKPKDGDSRSDKVIWGHVIDVNDPWINIHFIFAHLTERILTEKLRGTTLERFTTKKDWSFALSTTMVGFDGVRNFGASKTLLPIWRLPRPNGLGWIREEEIEAYSNGIS